MRFAFIMIFMTTIIVLASGCCCLPQRPSCEKPYTAIGDECCIDADANQECDIQEITTTSKAGTDGSTAKTTRKASTTIHAATTSLPLNRKDCENLGGRWGRIGLGISDSCNLPARDAGKICSNQKDCEGSCIAPDLQEGVNGGNVTGTCSDWQTTVGCIRMVDGGRAFLICID